MKSACKSTCKSTFLLIIIIFRDFSGSALLADQMKESVSSVTNNGEGFLVYCTGNLHITCMSYENNWWNVRDAQQKCKK